MAPPDRRREVVVPVPYPGDDGLHVGVAWGYLLRREHLLECLRLLGLIIEHERVVRVQPRILWVGLQGLLQLGGRGCVLVVEHEVEGRIGIGPIRLNDPLVTGGQDGTENENCDAPPHEMQSIEPRLRTH